MQKLQSRVVFTAYKNKVELWRVLGASTRHPLNASGADVTDVLATAADQELEAYHGVTFPALYAMIARQPVGRLWLAGILPGLMMAGMFILYIVIRCRINPALGPVLPKEDRDIPMSEKLKLLSAGLLSAIGLGQVARRYSEERLGDEMSVLINREVIEHASSLDLAFFEQKENHDILNRASRYPGRGSRWLSAGELARWGAGEVALAMPVEAAWRSR